MNIATSIIVKISQKILGCTCIFETFKSYPHSPLQNCKKFKEQGTIENLFINFFYENKSFSYELFLDTESVVI